MAYPWFLVCTCVWLLGRKLGLDIRSAVGQMSLSPSDGVFLFGAKVPRSHYQTVWFHVEGATGSGRGKLRNRQTSDICMSQGLMTWDTS